MPVHTAPADINGAGVDSLYFGLSKYQSMSFAIALGAITTSAAGVVTFQQATDSTGTGVKTLTFPTKYTSGLSSGTTASTLVTGATGLTIGGTDDNKIYLFDILAQQLDIANGFCFVRARISDPGQACVATIVAIPGNPNNAGSQTSSLGTNARGTTA
tara:strand:+ start:774 stop:1247 length:474 start_codon:yes stop_codon:yes gene_type:complete